MNHAEFYVLSEKSAHAEANEDHAGIDAEIGVFIVADGIGGRPGGIQASRIAVQSFLEYMRSLDKPARLDEFNLRNAAETANHKVRSVAETNPLMTGLGTTLSAVILDHTNGKLVHVGDSRIYLLREGNLSQLTRDHTLMDELLEHKHISPEAANRHPLRNVLSRAIGSREMVEPDIDSVALKHDDYLILATDGLGKALESEHLVCLARSNCARRAEEICREIMDAATAKPLRDDVTVAVVRILEAGVDV